MLSFFPIWCDSEAHPYHTTDFELEINAEVQKGIRDLCSMDSTQSIMTQCVIAILWDGESGSPVLTFLKLRWCPWQPLSTAETENPALSGTLPCSPSCVSLGLGPELFCHMAPLDCCWWLCSHNVSTVLVGQRKACSSWKSVLEGSTGSPGMAVLRSALTQPAVSGPAIPSLPWACSIHLSSFGICTS